MRGRHSITKCLIASTLVAVIAVPQLAFAQTHASTPVPAASQQVEHLFVQNSAGVAVDQAKGTLRLKSVSPSTLFFSDRSVRITRHYHTKEEFLKLWNEGTDSFAKNPPNATLSILEPGKADLQNAVVVLRNPRM